MEYKALRHFLRKPVNGDMIQFLVNTTNSVIQIEPTGQIEESKIPSLYKFIEHLIKCSNVQTPTLMSTIVYLNRLRARLPANSSGMETTRHRIFVGCLILASKNLNDSSPLNKHWCSYTDGLICLRDVNLLEMELLNFIGFDNLVIKNRDLISNFHYFIEPIRIKLLERELTLASREKQEQEYVLSSSNDRRSYVSTTLSSSESVPSLVSSSSSSTIDSISSIDYSVKLNALDKVNLNTAYQEVSLKNNKEATNPGKAYPVIYNSREDNKENMNIAVC